MKKYKIIAAIVGFYALLAVVVLGINHDRLLFRRAYRGGIVIVNDSVSNPVGDFAIYFAGVCIVIGIVAFVVYEIKDSIKRRKEKKAEREKELRK